MKRIAAFIGASVLLIGVSRAAEKREERLSPLPAMSRALEVIQAERLPYDPKTWTISIQRRGPAWVYDFAQLPDKRGRVIPGAHFTITLTNAGQTSVFQGL